MVLDPLISSQFSVHSKVMALIIWPYLCSWLSWQKLSFKLNPEQRHQYYWDSCCPKMPRRLPNHSWKKILEPSSFFQAKFDRFGKILVASKKRRKKVLICQQQLLLFSHLRLLIILKVSQLSHNFSSFLNRDKIENLPKSLELLFSWSGINNLLLFCCSQTRSTTQLSNVSHTNKRSLYNFVCQFWNHIHIVCILYL